MENRPQKSYVWIYIMTGILIVLGLYGLVREDWFSAGYVVGGIGLLVWIHGSKKNKPSATRTGLILAGLGVAILLLDIVVEVAA